MSAAVVGRSASRNMPEKHESMIISTWRAGMARSLAETSSLDTQREVSDSTASVGSQ